MYTGCDLIVHKTQGRSPEHLGRYLKVPLTLCSNHVPTCIKPLFKNYFSKNRYHIETNQLANIVNERSGWQ